MFSTDNSAKYCLDTPDGGHVGRVTRFSGWCFSTKGTPLRGVVLSIRDQPFVQLVPSYRLDVAQAYPKHFSSAFGGFLGDLILPDCVALGEDLPIKLTARFADGSEELILSESFKVTEAARPFFERKRSYQLNDVLEDLEKTIDDANRLSTSRNRWQTLDTVLAGTRHFHSEGDLPIIRTNDSGPTHPYGQRALELIHDLPTQSLFLDLGSGIKSKDQLFDNAIYLDAVHFTNVDVVSSRARLPFKDEVFDLVVSQAVFEHLPSPFQMAREVFRVLKPGGRVLIDTAFMQPLHGDPNHYFNMTSEGLRLILESFEILELGSQPHQQPSYSLSMQFNAVLPFMKAGEWKDRLINFLEQLEKEGGQLDEDLGPFGKVTLAAGVYAVAKRPREASAPT
jgi:SAM-dependent methyltransferase